MWAIAILESSPGDQLIPGPDNRQDKQSGHGEIKAAYRKGWGESRNKEQVLYAFRFVLTYFARKLGLMSARSVIISFWLKHPYLCTELNEEWLINIF